VAAPDRGSATVETALALPSMVLLALALIGVVTGVATQIRCVDAARLAARATARGEDPGAVRTAVLHELPQAKLTVSTGHGIVHVDVSAPLSGLPLLGAFTVRAGADAAVEGDDDPGDGQNSQDSRVGQGRRVGLDGRAGLDRGFGPGGRGAGDHAGLS
jgi:hypothetical protein